MPHIFLYKNIFSSIKFDICPLEALDFIFIYLFYAQSYSTQRKEHFQKNLVSISLLLTEFGLYGLWKLSFWESSYKKQTYLTLIIFQL